ncbi:oxidoreductase [Solitalea longa]|uniref:Oxidoreductase n=1 Tax=Solitalea longa TaxID=2079460 RepID=A0A2S4ZY10_9SPHI|nr:Gfo/Idh/MocA family oxidoreductase [Solitalea longa]POY34887.1 oxidoreductase [Solitalea longa]
MKKLFSLFVLSTIITTTLFAQDKKALRIGIVGLTHTHVHGILGRPNHGDLQIVGIVETDKKLAQRYAAEHGFSMDIVYYSLDEMIAKAKPEAVAAFGSIYEHLKVVEKCAPLGIHVMVEKPLAVSMEHAKKMEALAKKNNIHLLTNYETSWYPSLHRTYELLKKDSIGNLSQIIVRDGHRGPKKIGVNEEFLVWLTDPVQNGGGAITDFGCYGANISTWMQNGKKPLTVTAVTQQFQPENNPHVDDEATIILTYEHSKTTIQASWNWPIGRKDMEVYGTTGVLFADNRNNVRMRIAQGYDWFKESTYKLDERTAPYNDPFSLFAAVIRNEIILPSYDLSSLENNMMVVEILDAARKSAKTGMTVKLK